MIDANDDEYRRGLITAWELNYKQGQLTLWIFLSLQEGSKTVQQIGSYLNQNTQGYFTADEKSLYRSLRRYYETEMVQIKSVPSDKGGPPLNIYSLTETGSYVLEKFVQRNISKIIENKQIREIL